MFNLDGIAVRGLAIFPTTIIIPLWPMALACLVVVVVPILWKRRHTTGHCLSCGYDFTGNTSGICPECGVRIGR